MHTCLSTFAAQFGCRSLLWLALVSIATNGSAQFGGSTVNPRFELWVINVDGAGLHKLVETPGFTCGSPRWSPDGTLVAYDTWQSDKSYDDSQIAIIKTDGTGLKLIGPGGMPSFSPNGKQLACHTYDNPQTIVVMNADGSGRETIIDHWGSPRWSPKGDWIASIDPSRRFFLFDLKTGADRAILPGVSSNIGFGISPDGRQICYGDMQGGIYLATLDDQHRRATIRQLTALGNARQASWSPDGKRIAIAYKPPDKELEQVYIIDADTNDPPKLLPGQDVTRPNAGPAWSPDGKTIVFASQAPAETPENVQ